MNENENERLLQIRAKQMKLFSLILFIFCTFRDPSISIAELKICTCIKARLFLMINVLNTNQCGCVFKETYLFN